MLGRERRTGEIAVHDGGHDLHVGPGRAPHVLLLRARPQVPAAYTGDHERVRHAVRLRMHVTLANQPLPPAMRVVMPCSSVC